MRIVGCCALMLLVLCAGCRTASRPAGPGASPPGRGAAAPALPPHEHPAPANWPASDSVEGRLRTFGATARGCWRPDFQRAGVSYPPRRVTLVALKQERVMEVYAGAAGRMRLVRRMPILAASGGPGPKLRQGDCQVPEGVYALDTLNPNSICHVSLHVNYPNAFDRRMAARDGRGNLGGDIMLHGGAASAGCLAIGDAAAEDLFALAADVGLPHMTLIIAPYDFRAGTPPTDLPTSPPWVGELYAQIRAALDQLR